MYEHYLGKGYHEKIRTMLTLPEEVLPNSVIDADLNIGAMKELLSPAVERVTKFDTRFNRQTKFELLQQIALYYLCGVLCMAMKSRTSAPPFNVKKYQKRWDKKREGYMRKGNMIMQRLMCMG